METIKNFKSLVAFEKVAKFRSYSLAAKELKVSKAYISKLVQELEDDLGQRLFNRSTRVVELTEVGDRFYQACSNSFQNIIKAQNHILSNADRPSGKLKISVAGVFGEKYISPFVFSYLKKYPDVEVELIFEEKLVDLLKESYDFAIRVGNLKDSALISKKIANRKEYVCASADYLNINGTPKTPEDLKKHNCLSLKPNWSFVEGGKTISVPVKGNYLSNNGRTLASASVNGLGITYLPKEYVEGYIKGGKLISILESYTPEEIPIWLLSPSKKNLSLNARTFIAELSERDRYL